MATSGTPHDESPDPVRCRLLCPCGELLIGQDEDDLVKVALAHLADRHPGREYTREQILLNAF